MKNTDEILNVKELMLENVNKTQKVVSKKIALLDEKEPNITFKEEGKNNTFNLHYFTGGKLIEKGYINVRTNLKAPMVESLAKSFLPENLRDNFRQYTISIINLSLTLFPHSPFIPSFGAHCRYFEIEDENQKAIDWFFGGMTNMEPYYLFEEDIINFHSIIKKYTDQVEKGYYDQLKKAADKYLYVPCRKQHVGVGGIFSHKMCDHPKEVLYEWASSFLNNILPTYLPIVEKRMKDPYTEMQKKWQLIQRGRFVEFLLLYDEGVQLGLKSGVNAENVLMSLPPLADWDSTYTIQPNSPEAKMMEVYKTPREWA